jgi:signal transduction histidine kinase
MWVSGLLSLWWPMLSRFQAAWIGSICYWLLFVLSVFHAQTFLNTKQSSTSVHRQLQALALLWLCVVPLFAWFLPEWLRSLLLWGGTGHTLFMLRLAWLHKRRPSARPHTLYLGVWVVYASSVLVYWLYRWFEWPLLTTLGVQFVQGAVVSTLLGLAASIQVIGEREQLARGLLMSQARARWYAAAQHDLWQPLQSIQLYAQALLKAPVDQWPTLVKGLKLASQSVDDFMNHLRFFAEGTASTVSTHHLQSVCIDDVIKPLVEEFRPLAQMRHLVLRYRPSHANVKIDPYSVQRMVRNLLTNAIHHTPAGGRVLLACQRRGQVLWLLSIDNGMGMSPDQVKDCFEAFTRFDLAGEGINKLGLGLFSVKQQALQHQMPTRLQSVQGRGTLVGFGMPLMSSK